MKKKLYQFVGGSSNCRWDPRIFERVDIVTNVWREEAARVPGGRARANTAVCGARGVRGVPRPCGRQTGHFCILSWQDGGSSKERQRSLLQQVNCYYLHLFLHYVLEILTFY